MAMRFDSASAHRFEEGTPGAPPTQGGTTVPYCAWAILKPIAVVSGGIRNIIGFQREGSTQRRIFGIEHLTGNPRFAYQHNGSAAILAGEQSPGVLAYGAWYFAMTYVDSPATAAGNHRMGYARLDTTPSAFAEVTYGLHSAPGSGTWATGTYAPFLCGGHDANATNAANTGVGCDVLMAGYACNSTLPVFTTQAAFEQLGRQIMSAPFAPPFTADAVYYCGYPGTVDPLVDLSGNGIHLDRVATGTDQANPPNVPSAFGIAREGYQSARNPTQSLLFHEFRRQRALDGLRLSTDTIKVMLVDGYLFNPREPNMVVPNKYEVAGTGYTAGGETLTGKAIAADDANDRAEFDASDASWAGLNVGGVSGVVVYKSTGTASTDVPIAYYDTRLVLSGQDLVVAWDPETLVQVR